MITYRHSYKKCNHQEPPIIFATNLVVDRRRVGFWSSASPSAIPVLVIVRKFSSSYFVKFCIWLFVNKTASNKSTLVAYGSPSVSSDLCNCKLCKSACLCLVGDVFMCVYLRSKNCFRLNNNFIFDKLIWRQHHGATAKIDDTIIIYTHAYDDQKKMLPFEFRCIWRQHHDHKVHEFVA